MLISKFSIVHRYVYAFPSIDRECTPHYSGYAQEHVHILQSLQNKSVYAAITDKRMRMY